MTAGAQQPFAAILAAHGDRGGPSPNAALRAQAERVAALLPGVPLFTGMLKGEPTIEQALAEAAASGAQRVAVYPLFMADGYFVRKLGERIAAAGYGDRTSLLTPLGLDPALPDVLVAEAVKVAETLDMSSNLSPKGSGARRPGASAAPAERQRAPEAREQARERTMAVPPGFAPSSSRLLIVGHGSKLGPASATATRKVATRVALARRFASVTTAFLEEEPFLDDALRASSLPTIVAGFFFGEGLHGSDDVQETIAETGANAVYAGVIGNSPAIAPLIAAALMATIPDRDGSKQS